MTDSLFLSQIPQLLKDWIPESASIAIADKRNYILYRPGEHNLSIEPGDMVPPGSIARDVFAHRDRIEREVDSSVFGVPYYGVGYFLYNESGAESALTVIMPPKRRGIIQSPSYLMGHRDGVWRPIALEDVIYMESLQKRCWIHTKAGSFTTETTLQSLEERLPTDRFIRIHRSYIVNIAFIDTIYRNERSSLIITLKSTTSSSLPVAQSYVRYVRSTLGF